MAHIRRRMILVGGAVLCLLAPHWAAGVEPPETPKFTQACRSAWLNFSIVSGRIRLIGTRFGNLRSSSRRGLGEQLTIQIKPSGPVVAYELVGEDVRVSVDASAGDHLVVQWQPRGDSKSTPLEYRQLPGKPVSLKIGPEDKQEVYEAASLWHLMLAHPEPARQYLVPLVRMFQTDIDPVSFAEELESELLRVDSPVARLAGQRWAALVTQLGDDAFARREAADRELREAGGLVVTFLRQLDPAQLDAEQEYRIHRILQALTEPAGADTPESVAAWLGGDPSVWLLLLQRDDGPTLDMAKKRFEELLGHSVAFDVKADRATRRRQLEQLRAQIQNR